MELDFGWNLKHCQLMLASAVPCISETPQFHIEMKFQKRQEGQWPKFFPPLNIGILTSAVKATRTVNKVFLKGLLTIIFPLITSLLFAFISDWGSGLVAIGFP